MQLIRLKLLKFWDEGLFMIFFWFEFFYVVLALKFSFCNSTGWLIGFISKQDASSQMVNALHSTFLLRFSDTQTGAVSIGFVCDDEDGKGNFIFSS